jgi:hypothetical protein
LGRIHFFEIEDQPWCPRFLRDAGTEYLEFMETKTGGYRPIAKRLARAIERTGSGRVVDLGSGSGGPWLDLLPEVSRELGRPLDVRLTDRYPNPSAIERTAKLSGGALRFEPRSVDALDVPKELEGFRTMFSSFHHFRPEQARALLADAVRKRTGIAVFEATERSLASILSVCFAPLVALAITPWLRPFRFTRLLFTYLIPVIPLFLLFDGVVSCLRCYSPDELRGLTEELGARGYRFEIGVEPVGRLPVSVTYLIATPEPETA